MLKFHVIQARLVLVQEAAVLAFFLAMFSVLYVRIKRMCVYVCMHVQVFSF